MRAALLLVIAVGALIGFLLPGSRAPAPAEAATPADGYRETLLERRYDGHFYVDALVNGRTVRFLVDTGATTVALTTEDAQRIGIDFDPNQFSVVARSASGDVLGQNVTLDYVDIEGKRVPHIGAQVAQNLPVSLLGQAYLARISGVQMNGDYMTLR